jgi:spore germination protein YaaH
MYVLEADGKIKVDLGKSAGQLLRLARKKDVRIVPAIQNVGPRGFDGDRVRKSIATPEARAQHVAQLAALASSPSVAGLNLDYESLGASDKETFMTFIEELAAALHAKGKVLSVCAAARTRAEPTWEGALVFDWPRLAAAADEVVVMAYDFSWPGGPPGPIAPRGWFLDVASYASSVVPPERLRIALPLYGYDWGGEKTEVIPQREAPAWARKRAFKWKESDLSADLGGFDPGLVATSTYVDDAGRPHTAYYEPIRASEEKLGLLARLGLRRVAFWQGAHASDRLLDRISSRKY